MLYIWETDHPPAVILERLANSTLPDHPLRANLTTGPFLQMESDTCFRIRYRTALMRNDFRRNLYGRILPMPQGGTRIEARLRLPFSTTLFLCVLPFILILTAFVEPEALMIFLPVAAILLLASAFRGPVDQLLQVVESATGVRHTTQSNRQDV